MPCHGQRRWQSKRLSGTRDQIIEALAVFCWGAQLEKMNKQIAKLEDRLSALKQELDVAQWASDAARRTAELGTTTPQERASLRVKQKIDQEGYQDRNTQHSPPTTSNRVICMIKFPNHHLSIVVIRRALPAPCP
jgi:hypothetical protein